MNTSATFSALAEPNRLHIIELLREGPCSVGEIADRLVLRQPQASKHLRVLSAAGLVAVRPLAKLRVYHLQPQAFDELSVWLESFTRTWNERFNAFDGYLQVLKGQRQEQGDDLGR
jgi:DNA-binding transcriptional ArsR family regulator